MISDAEISNNAVKHGITLMGVNPATFHESRSAFAREMYERGRREQRYSDERILSNTDLGGLREVPEMQLFVAQMLCAYVEAIRNNTGELENAKIQNRTTPD